VTATDPESRQLTGVSLRRRKHKKTDSNERRNSTRPCCIARRGSASGPLPDTHRAAPRNQGGAPPPGPPLWTRRPAGVRPHRPLPVRGQTGGPLFTVCPLQGRALRPQAGSPRGTPPSRPARPPLHRYAPESLRPGSPQTRSPAASHSKSMGTPLSKLFFLPQDLLRYPG